MLFGHARCVSKPVVCNNITKLEVFCGKSIYQYICKNPATRQTCFNILQFVVNISYILSHTILRNGITGDKPVRNFLRKPESILLNELM